MAGLAATASPAATNTDRLGFGTFHVSTYSSAIQPLRDETGPDRTLGKIVTVPEPYPKRTGSPVNSAALASPHKPSRSKRGSCESVTRPRQNPGLADRVSQRVV